MINMFDVQRGYDAWAAKPHNAKWVRKIDGTPIANDIVATIWNTLRDTMEERSASPSREETEGEKEAVTYSQEEYDEAYEIGKRDGYSDAVQDIDEKTGGDGEYRYCLGMEDDIRHQPDPATMIQRIVDRFETLNLLDDASKSGRDQEWGDRPDPSALLLEAEKALEEPQPVQMRQALDNLLYQLEPFIAVATIVMDRPQDYPKSVASVGGLGNGRGLRVEDFRRLHEARSTLSKIRGGE